MEDHVGLDKSHRLLEVRSGLERKAITSMIVQIIENRSRDNYQDLDAIINYYPLETLK